MVVLKVGPEREEFQVHRGLLCKSSPYFRNALEDGFKEAETQIIEWPEEEPRTVRIFQLWLYSGSMGADMWDSQSVWGNLVDTYIFANACDLPVLKESVIDTFIEMQYEESLGNVGVLDKVYNTPSAKPLRKLFVDFAIHDWSLDGKDWLREKFSIYYPKQYLVEVLLELHDQDKSRKWTSEDYKAARAKYLHSSTE